jgi:hypothetical protein
MTYDTFLADYANLGAELFDEEFSESDLDLAESIAEVEPEDFFIRAKSHWQQVPVPPDINLCGTNLLSALDDDTLLTMSPTLLVHIQRTEASNGLQVVSPRAVTLGGIAARTNHTKRTPDMLLVGSAASRNLDWPVVREPLPSHLTVGEPIDSYPSDPAIRPKTVSTGLVPSSRVLTDPVTRAFLTGRALVDLQRRPDVSGSADALSAVLARCWSLSEDAYADMAEASLAPVGPLLRYAIRADDSYPTVNAPIQARKCISVGANATGRQLYGEESAIDWRRLRVLAEAVFYQSSRLEGYTLAEMSGGLPPGNPRAPPNRAGILQMRPLPGSVWSFEATTFRLDITADPTMVPGVRVPARVRDAVTRYHETVRPIAVAVAAGMEISFSRTLEIHAKLETAEALMSGYRKVVQANSTQQARGKTAVAAVRSYIYDVLATSSSLSTIRAMWMATNMQATVKAHNLSHLLDVTTSRHVAARLSDMPVDLRMRLGVEAGKRGSDLLEWWEFFSAQLPQEIASMSEGSASWAIGLAHLLINPPTEKWVKLTLAMSHASHATLARSALSTVRLPAILGSEERSFQAGAAVAKQLGASYGAYYAARYDVACILAARMRRGGNEIASEKLLLAGLMWDIRSKVASTVSLHSSDATPEAAGVFTTKHGRYHITTAPYPAYQRWQRAVLASKLVPKDLKVNFPHHSHAIISTTFRDVNSPLFPAPAGSDSVLLRYARCPGRLAVDIEKTLSQICADTKEVMVQYDNEATMAAEAHESMPQESFELSKVAIDLNRYIPAANSYWALISDMEPLSAEDIVDTVTRMDSAVASDIESRTYRDEQELRAVVWGAEDIRQAAAARARDAIV